MASERVIRVVLDSSGVRRGSRTVQGELQKIEGNTRRTSRELGFLRGALIGVFSVATVRQIGQAADAYAQIQNRLRLVTDGTAELTRVSDELFASSQRTRTSFQSTAELYARVARSTEQLGISQQRTLEFTETVSQAIQVSGATAQEASQGVIQFAQGLASGALRGDELRSVLEQMPRLARALADGLGVGIGELRELGEEGELTTERILDALQSVAPEIADEFAQLTPTIGQAFTVLQNSVLNAIGELDKMLGISKLVTDGIMGLSESIDGSTSGLQNFALWLARILDVGNFVVQALDALASGFGFVGRAIAALLAGNLEALREEADATKAEFLELFEAETVTKFQDALRENLQTIKEIREEAQGVDLDVEGERTAGPQLSAAEKRKLERDLLKQQREEERRINELRKNRESDDAFIRLLEKELELVGATNEELAVQANLYDLSENATRAQRDEVRRLTEEIEAATEALEERNRTIDSITGVLESAAQDLLIDFESIPNTIKNIANNLLEVATQLLIIEPLVKSFRDSLSGASGGGSGLGSILGALGLPGFASGGSFEVGGRGGTDQNVVAFRASRGENVTVTPRGQSQGGSGPVVQTTNVQIIGAPEGTRTERQQNQTGGEDISVIIDQAVADSIRAGSGGVAIQERFNLTDPLELR